MQSTGLTFSLGRQPKLPQVAHIGFLLPSFKACYNRTQLE